MVLPACCALFSLSFFILPLDKKKKETNRCEVFFGFLTYVGCSFVFLPLRGVLLFSYLCGVFFCFLTYVGCGEAGEDVQMSHRD